MAINRREPATGRSLADDIRGRDDRELATLVLSRPDLARPAPADLTSLAARASTRASVQRAIDALDEGHLRVLEALVVAAEPTRSEDLHPVLGLLGVSEAEAPTVRSLVDDLWARALLWRGSDGTHVVRTVPEVLGPSVAGLGPSYRDLRPGAPVPTEAQVRGALDVAPEGARTVLDRLTWGPATGVLPTGPAGTTAVRWLLERNLLVSVGSDRVALPRETGLVLRGGRLHRSVRLRAPEITARDVSARVVDAVAGGAASDLLSRVDELCAAWGAEPPRVLRAGGLSVRDLKVAGRVLDVEPERAAFVVEVSYAAGLVGDDGEIVPVWAPTPELDEWSASAAGHRWAVLAKAWLASTRAPHLVGSRVGETAANALGPGVQWPAIRGMRREVLVELASLEPGMAADGTSIRERLHWRRPLRTATLLDGGIDGVLREAEWLGVTGRGALSSPARTLLGRATATDPSIPSSSQTQPPLDEVAAAMSPHLPAPVDHILVQADLTAVAPGPLEGSLAAFMRLASEVESRGGATVHRFTPDSVRRTLDAGWTAADVLDTIRRASRTPLPQPLEYLVTDVARKHGVTRVGSSAAYVRSDDEAVLDAMLATRDLAPLRLRRLAPTVLVSDTDPRLLVDLLRDGGFSPVVEGRDGGVVLTGAEQRRARARRRTAAPTATPVDEAFTANLVAGLRAAEASADERRAEERARPGPSIPTTDPVVTLALLREAMADGHGVWIGVTDQLGATTRHLIHPRRVEGGRVYATDEAGRERTWTAHRITGATLDTP
ncbi:helicase-associated domain-containing protein [Intrasporangium calvum]|uniref:helicase-associated domain-containing protein n=1 Tax=Intrasporangium calvum TaxID=53358 RepID=UPI000DF60F67|nr:helicase-associated domain-containing protein [Intrasporangium calvum]AXG12516.1 hypothetical protein DN585_02885 [Intrasporangium calvum]